MIKIAIIGGSRPEIRAFVEKAKEKYKKKIEFHVFDYEENIGEEDLWVYYKCESAEEMAIEAVKLARLGVIDILVKGIVPTHVLLKAVLNKEYSLKNQDVLSHVSVISLPQLDRKILLTDAAMNIAPDTEQLINIVENVIEVANKVNKEKPKVALLSSAENYNPKMPSSVIAKEVTEHFEKMENAIVYGPLSFDLAMSEDAVKSKGFSGEVAGNADVLVVPNIDVGNVLYKSLVLFGGAVIGGIIVGTTVPVVLTSRSDSIESKLIGLELAIQQVQ